MHTYKPLDLRTHFNIFRMLIVDSSALSSQCPLTFEVFPRPLAGKTKNGYFNVLIEFKRQLKTQKMNYRSVFLATTILVEEKSSTSCLIARHLDEKSRDCKQRIETYNIFQAT